MHQAVLVNVSNMLREMLLDTKNYYSQEYPLLILLDHDSKIVRKMLELIFTGKSVIGNQRDVQSLQNLLSSLGLCLDIAMTVGSAEYFTQTLDVTYQDIEVCSQLEEPVKKKLKSTVVVNEMDSSIQVAWYSSVKEFSLTPSLQARVQLRLSDKVRSRIKNKLKKHHTEVSKLDSCFNQDKEDLEVVQVKAERTSLEFLCPVCSISAKFKIRNKLIKHLVDDHYYEELENLLVGGFFESSVCCKIDFAKSGFGMYIRHKAEKHNAVQNVATEEVRKHLDSQVNHGEVDMGCEIKVADDGTKEMGKSVKYDVGEAAYDDAQEELAVKRFLRVKSFANLWADCKNSVVSLPTTL